MIDDNDQQEMNLSNSSILHCHVRTGAPRSIPYSAIGRPVLILWTQSIPQYSGGEMAAKGLAVLVCQSWFSLAAFGRKTSVVGHP
jgi:hypothetical protein